MTASSWSTSRRPTSSIGPATVVNGGVAEVGTEDVVAPHHAHRPGTSTPAFSGGASPDGEQVVKRDHRGGIAGHSHVGRDRPCFEGGQERPKTDDLSTPFAPAAADRARPAFVIWARASRGPARSRPRSGGRARRDDRLICRLPSTAFQDHDLRRPADSRLNKTIGVRSGQPRRRAGFRQPTRPEDQALYAD